MFPSSKEQEEISDLISSWLKLNISDNLKQEILSLQSQNNFSELLKRLKGYPEFGTAGFRNIIGAGFAYVNSYTIQLISECLFQVFNQNKIKPLSIVIGYDTRLYSLKFAQDTAQVFLFHKCNVILFSSPVPTPIISFATLYYKADIAIIITASHNPKEYNGYKIYNYKGLQILTEEANNITSKIKRTTKIPDTSDSNLTSTIQPNHDFFDSYYQSILKILNIPFLLKYSHLIHVTYSPLFGTGLIPVNYLLEYLNIPSYIVRIESKFDGDFPTVKAPNPELPEVFKESQKSAQKFNSDVILITDPDADRIGVKIKVDNKKYQFLNGNEIGIFLLYYYLNEKLEIHSSDYFVASSIVSSKIIPHICQYFKVKHKETLTGFKYIADLIDKHPNNFIFGFEESHGYLACSSIRDKDGISTLFLIIEAILFLKVQNISFNSYMENIYKKFGKYKSTTFSIELNSLEKEKFIQYFEYENYKILDINILEKKDYKNKVYYKNQQIVDTQYFNSFNSTILISFYLENQIFLSVRPSGTEPLIKIYLEIHSDNNSNTNLVQEISLFEEKFKKNCKNFIK